MSTDSRLGELLDMLADRVAEKVTDQLKQQKQTGPVETRLLTIELAARYLGRTEEAVRHLIASGKIPTVRADKRIFVDIEDLDAWITSNKQT